MAQKAESVGREPFGAAREPSVQLRNAANFALTLAVAPLALLYGQWFLSCAMLGHMPRPSIDDPKYIDGASWMHPITLVGFVGILPTAVFLVVATIWYAAAGRPRAFDLVWRFAVLGVVVVLAFWDPFRVGYWWID